MIYKVESNQSCLSDKLLARLQDDNTSQGSLLTFAAADGFRLSVRADRLAAQVTQPAAAIIPARAMEELERIIKLGGQQFTAQEGPVSVIIAPGKNQVLFHLDNVDLASQLIDLSCRTRQAATFQTITPSSPRSTPRAPSSIQTSWPRHTRWRTCLRARAPTWSS